MYDESIICMEKTFLEKKMVQLIKNITVLNLPFHSFILGLVKDELAYRVRNLAQINPLRVSGLNTLKIRGKVREISTLKVPLVKIRLLTSRLEDTISTTRPNLTYYLFHSIFYNFLAYSKIIYCISTNMNVSCSSHKLKLVIIRLLTTTNLTDKNLSSKKASPTHAPEAKIFRH